MNLEQMRNAVRTRLGTPASDSFSTDQALTDILNEALQAYSVEYDWPWLEATTTITTVANTETYSVPTDWARTQVITPTSDYPLRLISLNEARQRNQVGGLLGALYPDAYTIARELVMLSPIPQSALVYKHDYIKVEPVLVGNTDTPVIPTQFVYSVIAKACALASLRGGDHQSALGWDAQYSQWLVRMRDNRRRSTAFPSIRVRPGSMI
jgi:hypothetical protein